MIFLIQQFSFISYISFGLILIYIRRVVIFFFHIVTYSTLFLIYHFLQIHVKTSQPQKTESQIFQHSYDDWVRCYQSNVPIIYFRLCHACIISSQEFYWKVSENMYLMVVFFHVHLMCFAYFISYHSNLFNFYYLF